MGLLILFSKSMFLTHTHWLKDILTEWGYHMKLNQDKWHLLVSGYKNENVWANIGNYGKKK